MTIGEALRKARKDKKYTLDKLQKKTGISKVSIGRWERGECFPNIVYMVEIADVFGITLDELVGRNVEQ